MLLINRLKMPNGCRRYGYACQLGSEVTDREQALFNWEQALAFSTGHVALEPSYAS